ncbi:PrsW family glutamic-type intramembrane protease [Muriicola sp. SD30]
MCVPPRAQKPDAASLAILRMVTAVPAHFVFAVIMGYYLG